MHNWNVQCDVGHYINILRYLLVASKVQTGVCLPHFEKPHVTVENTVV